MLKVLIAASAALVLLAGCSGDDDDNGDSGDEPRDAVFAADEAEELAHAALPAPGDLPGDGWEVVGMDDFGDDDGEDDEFFVLAQDEEACAQITDLATLGDLMGSGDDDDLPAGRAQVEFERADSAQIIPTTLEVELEIEETVSAVQGGWAIAKSVLESQDTSDCITALMGVMMEAEASGLDVTLEAIDPPAEAPQDGAALAFALNMKVGTAISIDAVMGLYMWPYSNAGVQVVILGPAEELTSDVVAGVLQAIDAKVVAAGE